MPVAGPTLSIIVCTYNRASFLPGCLGSIRASGTPDVEIVVVDDGSTDDTRSVIERLAGPDVVYIHQKNMGLSSARNTGIQASRGRYVAYLDSDDYWLTGGVGQRLVEFLDTHPNVGVAFADAKVGNDTKGYWSWIEWAGRSEFHALPGNEVDGLRVLEPTAFYRHLMRRNAVFTGAVVQRREVVVGAGLFDPRLNAAGDWELYLRMAAKNTFAYCSTPLAIYTQHDDNMTRDTDRMIREFVDTRRRHMEHGLPLDAAGRRLLLKFHKNEAFFYGYLAYDRGDYPVARRRFGESLRENGFDAKTVAYWLMARLPGPVRHAVRRANRRVRGA